MKKDSHYVPRSYLRRWAGPNGAVARYRTLVSNPHVPEWTWPPVAGVAWQEHLYTNLDVQGADNDDFERWFDREFEEPAKPVIDRVIARDRLTPTDWDTLARFLAAQDVRTPSNFLDFKSRAEREYPALIRDSLASSVSELEAALEEGRQIEPEPPPEGPRIPSRVRIEPPTDSHGKARLLHEVVIGRGLWLYHVHYTLTNTIRALRNHRWTVLRAPPGMQWITSDDPVVKLNFERSGRYNFRGGWASSGTDIFMPLSPTHLLFTTVGRKPPERDHVVSTDDALRLQRIIAEHSFRSVFATAPVDDVRAWRPRVENDAQYRAEAKRWQAWHAEQSGAERALLEGA